MMLFRQGMAGLVVLLLLQICPSPALADGEQGVVEDARATVAELLADPDFSNLHGLLARAHGAVIVPQLYKAGFIIGGEAGRAVILARDPNSGAWSHPAFMDMASASIGLQIGAAETQLVLVIMTDAGMEAMLSDKIEVGADASVAAGPIGAAAKAATTSTEFNEDIYAYGTSEGLFAGVSVEGAILIPDQDANHSFYGEPVTTREILQGDEAWNPRADGLRELLESVI
ncbi:MAG: lipid-binding SYLF domain-containing protein [Rhodospirillaceae bacterium]|jgi:SH3 domain-containing YSC84-like protein 1|nr:lipid-binding SYLF domain-containing protein [Rhodospirillaceae bacterium]